MSISTIPYTGASKTVLSTASVPGVPTQVNDVNVAAAFEIQSTDGGFLQARMTGAQMNALTPVVPGMQVFVTDIATVASGTYIRQSDDTWKIVDVSASNEISVEITQENLNNVKRFSCAIWTDDEVPQLLGTDITITGGSDISGLFSINTTDNDPDAPTLPTNVPVYGMNFDRSDPVTEGIGTPEEGTMTLWAGGNIQAQVSEDGFSVTSFGTQELPSYGFTGRPGLGMFSNGVASLALVAGEYKQVEIVDNGFGDNFLRFGGSATGNPVSITATGSDTNVSLQLVTKGDGQILIDGGTQALPALSFNDQTNLGIYKRSSNSMAFVAGGNIAAAIDGGKFVVQDGSAENPTLSFLNTQTTGLFKTNTNGLGITVEGSEVLRATSEQILLNGGSQEGPALSFNGDSDIGLFRSTSPGLGVSVGGEQCAEFSESGLSLLNRDAPSEIADTVQLFSSDLTAGNTTLSIQTEGTPVSAISDVVPTQNIAIKVNGTTYYLMAKIIV